MYICLPTQPTLRPSVFVLEHWRIQTPLFGGGWGSGGGQPSPPVLSRSPSLLLEVGPLNAAGGLGSAVSSPSWVYGGAPSGNRICCILALKSDIWWHQFYQFSRESIDHSVCHGRIGGRGHGRIGQASFGSATVLECLGCNESKKRGLIFVTPSHPFFSYPLSLPGQNLPFSVLPI